MTTQRQRDSGDRPPPIRGSRRVFELTDRAGNVVAQTTDRQAALRLRRADPSLQFRGVDRPGPPPPGTRRAEDVLAERQARRRAERQEEQASVEQGVAQRDIETLRPFMDQEGRVDVVAALEAGVSQETLNRLIPEEGLARARSTREALQAVEPFRAEDGQVDLVAALNSGVPQETLERLFEPPALQRAESVREALRAVAPFRDEGAQVDVVAALQGGVAPETLQEVFDPEVVESGQLTVRQLQEIQPFRNEQGEVDLVAAMDAGVSRDTLGALFSADSISTAESTRRALQEVAPFRSDQGQVNIVAALQSGVEPETLERLFAPEAVQQAQLTTRQLAEIAPFRDQSGQVDLLGAIEGGVSQQTLSALFEDQAVTQARATRAALEAVEPFRTNGGQVNIIQALESGVSPETLEALFTPQDIQRAQLTRSQLQQIAPFRDDQGQVDLIAALQAGVPQDTLNTLFEPETVTQARATRTALEAVEPFRTNGGQVNVIAALEGGVSPDTLESIFAPAAVQQAQLTRSQLQEIAPFRGEDGQVDLIAALEGGVSQNTLNALFESEAVTRAQSIRQARADLGNRSPVEFIRQGGDPQVLRTVGVDDATVDALVAVRSFINAENRIDTREAQQAGVSTATFQALGITPPPPPRDPLTEPVTRFERDAARLFEITRTDALDRERNQALASLISGVSGERITAEDVAREGSNALLSRAVNERWQQMTPAQRRAANSLDGDPNRLTQGDINRAVLGVKSFNRFTRQVTDPIERRFREEEVRIINRYEKTPAAIFQAAREGRELPPIGAGVSNIPTPAERRRMEAQIARERGEPVPVSVQQFPSDTRFQLRDPRTGQSVGFASGQAAVTEAQRQGFEVVPVTIRQAPRPVEQEGPLTPEFLEQVRAFQQRQPTLELQEAQREARAMARFSPEARTVLALERVDGELDLSPRLPPGQRLVLDIQPAEAGFDLSPRVQPGRFSPEQISAYQDLIEAGFANVVGGQIDIFGVIEAGQQSLAVQAGLTPAQVRQFEQQREDMLLALEGGQPGGPDATGLPVPRAFPVAEPRTTRLATPEAIAAAERRQREIDEEMATWRRVLRDVDQGVRGPEVRFQAQEAINRLAEEKTQIQNSLQEQAVDRFQQIWDAIQSIPGARATEAGPDGRTITLSPEDPRVVGGSPALPVAGAPVPRIPGLPQVRTPLGPTGVAVGIGAAAIAAEVIRRNPELRARLDAGARQFIDQTLASVRREQVTPEVVSPPAFPRTALDVRLPGTALGAPPEIADVPRRRVEPPTLPGTAREVPPEVVTVLTMAADVVDRESDIRRTFPGEVPESVEDFLDRPTAPEPTVAVPLDVLVDEALSGVQAEPEARGRMRIRLAELERRRRVLAQAQAELVASQGFSPQDSNNPEVLAAATAAAFESVERRGPGTTPERGPGRPTLPTRETAPPGRPERPDIRDDPAVFPDAIGVPIEGEAEPWVLTVEQLNRQSQREGQPGQQAAVSPASQRDLINNLQGQLNLTNQLQNQLANQPALANELNLANQLSQNLQQQLSLQQRLALNPSLAQNLEFQQELQQALQTQTALKTRLRTATRVRPRTRARTRTRSLTRTRTLTRTLPRTMVRPRVRPRPLAFGLGGDEEEPPDLLDRLTLRPRIVGVHHGAFERIIDLESDRITVVKDDPRIPNVPSRQSFTVLAVDLAPSGVREFPMGVMKVRVTPENVDFKRRKRTRDKALEPKEMRRSVNSSDAPRIIQFQDGDFRTRLDLQSGEFVQSPGRGPDRILATNREFEGPSQRVLGADGSRFEPVFGRSQEFKGGRKGRGKGRRRRKS